MKNLNLKQLQSELEASSNNYFIEKMIIKVCVGLVIFSLILKIL